MMLHELRIDCPSDEVRLFDPVTFVNHEEAAAWMSDARSEPVVMIVDDAPDKQEKRLLTASGSSTFDVYPRFGPRHLLITAPGDMDYKEAARHIAGTPLLGPVHALGTTTCHAASLSTPGKPVSVPKQGSHTCWLDAILVLMRFTGIGRFAGDMISDNALDERTPVAEFARHIINHDWPLDDTPAAHAHFGKQRDRLLDMLVDKMDPEDKFVEFGPPTDVFDILTTQLPSVSFHLGNWRSCPTCEISFLSTAGVELCTGLNSPFTRYRWQFNMPYKSYEMRGYTVQGLLDERFTWKRDTSLCRECRGVVQVKSVIIDRPPHLLKLHEHFVTFPGNRAGHSFTKPIELTYTTAVGTRLMTEYRPVAFVHGHGVHVTLTLLATANGDNIWLSYDGQNGIKVLPPDTDIKNRLLRLGVHFALFGRVYTDVTKEGDAMVFRTEKVDL